MNLSTGYNLSVNHSHGDPYQELAITDGIQRKKPYETEVTGGRMSVLPTEKTNGSGGDPLWQAIIIVFLTGSLSVITVVGNILVLISFKMNKTLKTVNNYYLLSLAFADLIIGTLSMNLYTTYIIMGHWALGPVLCDLWLAIDYVASNASVMNLLVISFDRYFSVTRPLTYRAKRTTKRAMTMIGLAWSISFILWAPAILFWQYVVGERTVPPEECYIQFLTEPITTFCTAIAAFYLPVTVMAFLFWKIYQETEKRAKDMLSLKGSCGSTNQNKTVSEGSERRDGGSIKPNQNNPSVKLHLVRTSSSRELYHQDGPAGDPRGSDFDDTSQSPTDFEKSVKEEDNKDPEQGSTIKSQQGSPPSSSNRQGVTMTIKDAALAKRFALRAKTEINKRKNEKKANEKKAARTLSAILLAFMMTWLPYNIMVLVNTFCQNCIPETLWALGYWLCYVNSTVNPMCYALCNKTFRTTFRDILMCRWNGRKKPHPHQRQAIQTKNMRKTRHQLPSS
ncbi:Muscarinic acetylcholine receptor M3 [Oryzias melastigma]|uniref:Muscarinic acetylcholine receptor n=1 Tax=Oryzias melastigma TaxID=30732 RepID=A0A834BS57_ORYME|nr:Muscarinic acetylcholine receptor M3 [Oryzias melastigma]